MWFMNTNVAFYTRCVYTWLKCECCTLSKPNIVGFITINTCPTNIPLMKNQIPSRFKSSFNGENPIKCDITQFSWKNEILRDVWRPQVLSQERFLFDRTSTKGVVLCFLMFISSFLYLHNQIPFVNYIPFNGIIPHEKITLIKIN